MRRTLSLIAALAAVSTACSAPEPALPSTQDPDEVHEFLTGPEATANLESISSYKWPDEGAKPASYFEWIAGDATSADPAVASRAGESAHALAVFLGEKQSELDSISPKLVAAYGIALTPFQGALVGDDDSVRGFDELDTSNDFSVPRGVFAVIATNSEAGAQFVNHAYDRAQAVAADAAGEGCRDRAVASSVGPRAVRTAAELSGLAASADAELDSRRYAIDDVVHAMADACLSVAKAPPQGPVVRFISNSTLLSPDAAMRLDPSLEDYFQSQRDYLAYQGLSLEDFSDAYDEARGR
ncbi:hypothetical protein [Mycobacterium deserti]|uniref:Lipoprotein n=1 Tax=Mycobacterium deserti TaxID=2978347 RepID=A0ABT2MHK4_9MYCO|nr:hypothetical protein [Mycobacterium deserti]MCT7661769.1 hypothetical protein [Mycobacterium deserti]